MLYSMTGFGAAVVRADDATVSVELKTVNNRYFKCSLRLSEGYAAWDAKIEALLRETIRRGTVNASVRIRRARQASECRLNTTVLQAYFEQLLELGPVLAQLGELPLPRLDQLAQLPGVAETDRDAPEEENALLWQQVEQAVGEALARLQEMRKTEGESMDRDMRANMQALRDGARQIAELAPRVAPAYRQRLQERIEKALAGQNVALNAADLVREVALYADRCDISEEIVRFRSHLDQFETALDADESCGRKLDFLTQELFRETNTIGSKANDADIIRHVVEMKTVIERIREMVQNVE